MNAVVVIEIPLTICNLLIHPLNCCDEAKKAKTKTSAYSSEFLLIINQSVYEM